MRGAAFPPWLLPLACALVPTLAVVAAWALSVAEGHIPYCIPPLEGCVSISRAARHGTGNLVFKLLMIPAAALQALHWAHASRFAGSLPGAAHLARGILPLGLVAGAALATYAAFLGVEGAVYGWLRRYGINFYFAGSFLAMVVYLRALREARAAPRLATAMTLTCLAMLLLGLANVLAQVLIEGPGTRERLRDALEWQLGALFSLWFALHALLRRWLTSPTTTSPKRP